MVVVLWMVADPPRVLTIGDPVKCRKRWGRGRGCWCVGVVEVALDKRFSVGCGGVDVGEDAGLSGGGDDD